MPHLTKPWKHMKRYYWDPGESNIFLLSQKLTKMFAFKIINKVIFSKNYLDLVIKVESGESLVFKNYYCSSCAENDYNQHLIQKMYEDQFLGITCQFVLIKKITFYQTNIEAYEASIIGLKGERGEICGFRGNIFSHPRT